MKCKVEENMTFLSPNTRRAQFPKKRNACYYEKQRNLEKIKDGEISKMKERQSVEK